MPLNTSSLPHDSVAILLCTCRGEVFLPQQLDSIAQQTLQSWVVWASDDSPNDHTDTHALLSGYREQWGRQRLRSRDGPRRGYAANFLCLLNDPAVSADFYAYADQDDVWLPGKLKRAVDFLKTVPADVPALYCGRTQLIDESNCPLGESRLYTRPPGFANALVQCIGGGNTMVFNHSLRLLLQEANEANTSTEAAGMAGAGCADVIAHDWWTYLLASGCGGTVFYDAEPMVRYRQHPINQMGENRSLSAQGQRARKLLQGEFRQWNERNLTALHTMRHRLTTDNQRILEDFAATRRGGLFSRLSAFRRSGVYRQTTLGNLGLWAAALLNKL